MSRSGKVFSNSALKISPMSCKLKVASLADLTQERLLVPQLSAGDHIETLKELAARLQEVGAVRDILSFYQAVLQHEYLTSVAAEHGVAFAHVRCSAVNAPGLAVGLSIQGIRWGGDQDPLVHAVLLLSVPHAAAELHPHLLGGVARLIRDDTLREELQRCPSTRAMMELLQRVKIASGFSHETNDRATCRR